MKLHLLKEQKLKYPPSAAIYQRFTRSPTIPPSSSSALGQQSGDHGTKVDMSNEENVPITIIKTHYPHSQKGVATHKRKSPLLVMVYGAYGQCLSPYYHSNFIPLLNR